MAGRAVAGASLARLYAATPIADVIAFPRWRRACNEARRRTVMTWQRFGPCAAVALLAGCAATVKPSGYLTNYQQLRPGEKLELFWSDPDAIARAQPSGIVLGAVDVRAAAPTDAAREQARQWLTTALLGPTTSATDRDVCGNGARPARLDVAITEIDPGSGFARVMAGELGAGHAFVQVEGKVTDDAGTLLASFADRQRDSGATGFRDTFGDAGPTLVQERLTAIGAAAREELALSFRCTPQ
jgi:hypothetical protein